MRVNLEDQGRQKVSFSFAQTKKPLQSPLFIPASNDTPVTEPQGALSQSSSDRAGKSTDGKAEQKQTLLVATSVTEIPSPTSVSSSTRLKTNVAKMHFKKQILNVSATVEKPASVSSEELHTSESQKLTSKSEGGFPMPQPQNSGSLSENAQTELLGTKESPISRKPAASQAKDSDSSSSTDRDNVYKRVTRSQLDSAPHASETDGESAHVSSRRQSADSKSKTNSDSRDKVKKSSSSSHVGEREKSSSKRSENHERSSSYSKSDRDSRNTSSRSSRLEKDRRRSRSRSGSRSRGARTSSSYARSERYRSDRGSRSERSYYHESDRRSHRSSPRRERRLSHSRPDRTRESSHSDEDHKRTRTTDSTRSSHHLNSYKESKSSSSKSDKSSKSVDSSQSSEFDKRSQSSKSERTSKRSDSDSQHKYSPVSDLSYRKSSSHHKSETNDNTSCSVHTQSKTHEKHHKSSSSDSEGKLHPTDKSTTSSDKCKELEKESKRPESKETDPYRSPMKSPKHDCQPNGINALSSATISETFPQSEKAQSNLQPERNRHSHQDAKKIAASTDKVFQESLSREDQEEKSELEIAITARESLNPENITLDNLYTVKECFSSNDQPHPDHDAAGLHLCKSGESIICKQGENVSDLHPKSSSDEPATQNVIQNTKLEIDKPNEVLALENQASKSETLEPDPSCLTNEGQQVKAQSNVDAAKKSSCSSRKSRWDIVGQDIFESDVLQKAGYPESSPAVKTTRFFNNICHDSEIQQELATLMTLTKQGQISEQEVSLDTITYKYKDQNEPSQASTTIYHCDLKPTARQTPTNSEEMMHMMDKQQILSFTTQSWNGEGQESEPKENTEKSKLSKQAPARQDVLGKQSEGSDSDISEYDSDCDKAIKQLHSVVVVPNNSSLTKDAKHREVSPRHAENLSALSTACLPAWGNTNEVPNQIHSKQTGQSGLSDSLISSVLCQSQSNMIDSTSHSEGASFMSTQPFFAVNDGTHGQATASIQTSDIFKKVGLELRQHPIPSQDQQVFSYYQREDPSTADRINDNNRFPVGWDFSQSEQPTSTYQQPDSSHGSLFTNTKVTGAASIGPEPRHAVASCTQQPPNMQTIKKLYLQEHYQDSSSEIHPDSLTNDHDDYSGDKLSSSQVDSLNTPGSSSFVQAHEISSNSRGSAVPDPSRDDTFRPHRGRGPPKKRRPEVESDSDNEAEVGPSSKRERQRETEVSKETLVKAEAQRPPLSLHDFQDAQKWKEFARSKKMPPYFDLIEENLYLTER